MNLKNNKNSKQIVSKLKQNQEKIKSKNSDIKEILNRYPSNNISDDTINQNNLNKFNSNNFASNSIDSENEDYCINTNLMDNNKYPNNSKNPQKYNNIINQPPEKKKMNFENYKEYTSSNINSIPRESSINLVNQINNINLNQKNKNDNSIIIKIICPIIKKTIVKTFKNNQKSKINPKKQQIIDFRKC